MDHFPMFDRLRAWFKKSNFYRYENILQDQSSVDRIIQSGEFVNFGQQRALLDQTNLQINRLERYKDFDQMDEVGEMHLALDLYADEASLVDPETHHVVKVKSPSMNVKNEIEDFLYNTLMVDKTLRPWVRYLVKYGDLPCEIVPTEHRNGVASVRHMNIYNFTRIETKHGDLVGFFYQDEMGSNPTYFHPWQVMHLKLDSLENIYRPYGKSILEGSRKHFKQLRLMEDAAIIYRVTRAPEKRVFTIPVNQVPTHEVPTFMEHIARAFKKKQFFDPGSGDVNERWNPLIQEDDFWLPQRDGEGPTVTTLPGAENLDKIADIEYFKKKMVSALKIPFSRVGIGEASEGDGKPLSHSSSDFARAVHWIQQELVIGLKKIIIVHLALRGYNAEEIRDFELQMTSASALEDLYRMEVWSSKAATMDALKGTGMFPDGFIVRKFTDLTDDEIEELEEEKRLEREAEMMMGMQALGGPGGGGGLPPPPGGGMGGDMMGGMPPPPMPGVDPMGPPGPGGEMGGMPPGPGGPGMGGPGMEGYDYGLERRLLQEDRRRKVNERLTYVRKNIKAKVLAKESYNYANRTDYYKVLLNSNELNGLCDSDDEVLIDHVLEVEDALEVITENYNVIMASVATEMEITTEYIIEFSKGKRESSMGSVLNEGMDNEDDLIEM